MSGGDPSHPPPTNGGDTLFRFIQNRHLNYQQPQQQPPSLTDPITAAVSPTVPNNNPNFFSQQQESVFQPSSNQIPSFFSAPHQLFDAFSRHKQQPHNSHSFFASRCNSTSLSSSIEEERELGFHLGTNPNYGSDSNRVIDPFLNSAFEISNHNSSSVRSYEKDNNDDFDRIVNGVLVNSVVQYIPSFHGGVDDDKVGRDEIDDSVLGEYQSVEKNDDGGIKKYHRDKDFRSDPRGKCILSRRIRESRRLTECRTDINRFDSQFLAIYVTLIQTEEEIARQKQLLTLLEQLVCKEWPNAKLYVYGSCANSFGVSKSDIDVCLAIDDRYVNKPEMLLKLADILRSENLQDVQALTHTRVPIVKLMDPMTGISCDICINNVLAVVNTKLLRDYANIDVRLRQLAFLVKHWAKSRGVNETYKGTLSSYAYVLMCIHFLQLRDPPILPCLQNMKSTYSVTVDDIECTFFDQVEKLRDFGTRNQENISKLLWGFFNYWAYCHDYVNKVLSVRLGGFLSKLEKDWTRRIGNDRHLLCIEDPFETSHDLGRVVDKYSIGVLQEEFVRAAEIMQYDPNPFIALFEPYIPR